MNVLTNGKAYLAAAGLLGLALYTLSQGDMVHAGAYLTAALTVAKQRADATAPAAPALPPPQ